MGREINEQVLDVLQAMVDAQKVSKTGTLTDLSGQLKLMGSDAIPALIAALDEPDEYIRRQAVSTLALFGEDGVEGVIVALENSAEHVRTQAATLLGVLGDKRALEPLKKRLEVERDAGTRRRIQTAISALNG